MGGANGQRNPSIPSLGPFLDTVPWSISHSPGTTGRRPFPDVGLFRAAPPRARNLLRPRLDHRHADAVGRAQDRRHAHADGQVIEWLRRLDKSAGVGRAHSDRLRGDDRTVAQLAQNGRADDDAAFLLNVDVVFRAQELDVRGRCPGYHGAGTRTSNWASPSLVQVGPPPSRFRLGLRQNQQGRRAAYSLRVPFHFRK